ncbi:MAG: hypothetical protein Q9209_006070 [Squamulea sp. 1 TL-2023]
MGKLGKRANDESTGQYRKTKVMKNAIGELALFLNDEIDAMDDAGRSQSQQFMNLAKAFKKQAEGESKAHMDDFESMVASRQDALTRLLEEKATTMYEFSLGTKMHSIADLYGSTEQEKRVRAMTIEVLSDSIAGQPARKRTMLKHCITQPAAGSILGAFDNFLAAHDRFVAQRSENEGPLSSGKPSKKDEMILEAVIDAQCEKGKQQIHRLLHGDNEEFHPTTKCLTEVAKGDKDWWSPKVAQQRGLNLFKELDGSTWHSVTKFAGKGIRRIVRGFPEASKM